MPNDLLHPRRFPFRRTDPLQPPPQYAQIRASQPVSPVMLWDGRLAWLVTRYEDVRAVTTDPRFSGEFANPNFPAVTEARVTVDKNERAFVGMDNPRHDHYRRMFTKEFSAKRMMALRPKITAIVNRLIDDLVAKPQPADLVANLAVPFPSLVMCDLVGSPYEDHTFIIECAAGRHGLLQTPANAEQKGRELADYFMRLIRRKEAAPGDDLVRYISPVQFAPRRVALEDVAIGDALIRAGDGVFTLNPVANRDPDAFPEPDRFDVRRDASHHLAFGWGIHQCLGQILARMELQIAFPLLLQRLPDLRIAAREGEIRFKDDMQIYGVHNLPVAW